MTISSEQISAKFFWAGTGFGDVSAGANVPGFSKPTTSFSTAYLIENPEIPNQRENGRGTWNPAGAGSLTRTTITFNGVTGARAGATKVDFSPSTAPKIVTLMSDPFDFGLLAGPAPQVGTAQIADDAVTFDKLANGTANTLLGYAVGGDPAPFAAGPNIVISGGLVSAVTSGEANTGANVATHGVGVFDGKVGLSLNFRGVATLTPGGLTIALDDAQNDIDFAIVYASAADAAAGTDNDKLMTALRVAEAIAARVTPGAPTDSQYLTLAAHAGLAAERVFTPQHSLIGADGGVGGSYLINLVNDQASPGPGRVYGTDPAGAKGWLAALAAVTSVNTLTGAVVLGAHHIGVTLSIPANYTPSDPTVDGHLTGIGAALGALIVGGSATFTPLDGTDGAILIIDNTHAGKRVTFDQDLTLDNTFCSGFTGADRPYVILWNVDTVDHTLTVEAGAGGTGAINGAASYIIPKGGRILLEGESNVVGDEPHCTAVGDSKTIDFAGALLKNLEIRDYKETVQALGNISGAVSIDYENGSIATATLTAAVTSLSFTNMDVGATITLIFNLAGFSLAIPATTQWPDGTPPSFGTGRALITYLKETTTPRYQGAFGGGNRA